MEIEGNTFEAPQNFGICLGSVCVFEYERGLYPLSGVRLPGCELHVWVPGEDCMQPDGFKCELSD